MGPSRGWRQAPPRLWTLAIYTADIPYVFDAIDDRACYDDNDVAVSAAMADA